MTETQERADTEEPMNDTFAFYGRVSTEDMQDPVASRLWQLDRARATIPAGTEIVAEYFDIDYSRSLPWARRPQAARLLSTLAETGRGFSSVVIGEPARAFHGNQYGLTFPLFVHYKVDLWVPEVGGRIDPDSDAHDLMMQLYGGMSKGERNRIRTRVRSSMASQTQHQGRFLGGRPPYGYRLESVAPHPNPRKAAEGASLHQLVRDADTAPVVLRIFEEYAAGRGFAGIARGLNESGIPSPAAHDPTRNPHRDATKWRDSAVRAILANPRYSGYQVWGRAPRSEILLDPTDVAAGATVVQRWAPEDQWYRSAEPSHESLVPTDLFEAVKDRFRGRRPTDQIRAARPAHGTYPLRGFAHCTICGRRLQGELRRGKRYYRCPTTGSARTQTGGHPVSVYLREDVVVPPLDKWLSEALSQEAAERTAHELASSRHSAELAARETAAKRGLADADRKIARLEQALEDGLPLSTFVRLARRHEIARDAAKAELARIKNHQPEGLTPEEFKAALEHARGLATALAGATDTQRHQLYEALGLEINYDPGERLVHASITPTRPVGVNRGVGGGT
jgi:site-specific DNA recombinase